MNDFFDKAIEVLKEKFPNITIRHIKYEDADHPGVTYDDGPCIRSRSCPLPDDMFRKLDGHVPEKKRKKWWIFG